MRKTMLAAGCAMAVAIAVLSARPHAQSFSTIAGGLTLDQNKPLYFEAASVKPSSPDNPPGGGIQRQPGGRFRTINIPLRQLIIFAYQIQPYQLVGAPDWSDNERYDIVAKFEGDPPPVTPGTPDHMMLAMRTLLADRFKLVTRRETREMDIYALTMNRPGGKPPAAMQPSNPEACSAEAFAARRGQPPAPGAPPVVCGFQGGPGRIRFGGFPLTLFASTLSGRVGRAVVDRTGLTGNWDFELTFAPPPIQGQLPPGVEPPPVDPNAPDLFTALREQLGLKLESTKGPVDVIVVDSVQRPTPD